MWQKSKLNNVQLLHCCYAENYTDMDLCMLEDLNQILLAHTTSTIKMNIRQNK